MNISHICHNGRYDQEGFGRHCHSSTTVMSLLEAPCTKTSWRVLLFHAIFGITGALIVCFDIWWFKQAKNRETGFGDHHCDFEQHMLCLTVHVCMNSVTFVLEVPGASILWRRYYSVTMCRLTWGGGLLLGRVLLIGTLRYFTRNQAWYVTVFLWSQVDGSNRLVTLLSNCFPATDINGNHCELNTLLDLLTQEVRREQEPPPKQPGRGSSSHKR